MTAPSPPHSRRFRPASRPADHDGSDGIRRQDRARPVRDVLRSALLHERFAGTGLPDEAVLAVEFSTSRNTVREALALLRDEGLVRRTQGRGTFPTAHLSIKRGRRIDVVVDAMAGGAERVELRLLRAVVQPAPGFVAERLGLPPRADVLLAERLGTIGGRPALLTVGFLPAPLAVPALAEPGSSTRWPYIREMEQRLGTALTQTEVAFDAVAADDGVAALLACEPGRPLLLLERVLVDDGGRAVELSYMRCLDMRVSFD